MRHSEQLSIALACLLLPLLAEAQPESARALLEQSAAAMGGLDRLRSLDNVVLTGFGLYLNQQGGGNVTGDPHAPGKWQAANYVTRTFDLKNRRALNQERRSFLFPFAATSGHSWAPSTRVQIDIEILDHPLPALLEALAPATTLGPVRAESGLAVVELTTQQSTTLWLGLDGTTHLPAWVRWVSGNAALGDVTNTAYFTGYLPFDGIQLPTGITTGIDWRDTRTSEFTVDSYSVNAPKIASFPAPVSRSQPAVAATSTVVAPHVWDVRYGGNGGAVIEFADHLTMFEAYASEAATFARLDLANTLVSGKRVTELIVSHHHFDHSGGLRAAVARGLTVISRRANEPIFREMIARPAPNFPDALARDPLPLKFVAVDEQLTLQDSTMRVDLYHVVGHLHMAEALFGYIPAPRIFLEGDFTTFDWDYNWWGGAYLDNVERYELHPAINIPVHGKVTTFEQTIKDIERQVANAKKLCAANEKSGIYMAGCPARYSRDRGAR